MLLLCQCSGKHTAWRMENERFRTYTIEQNWDAQKRCSPFHTDTYSCKSISNQTFAQLQLYELWMWPYMYMLCDAEWVAIGNIQCIPKQRKSHCIICNMHAYYLSLEIYCNVLSNEMESWKEHDTHVTFSFCISFFENVYSMHIIF